MVRDEGQQGPTRPQVVTTAPENLRDEQHGRMVRYLVTMGIRTASFVLAVVTEGWLRWTFVVLAVFLPYVAVVAANAVRPRALGRVTRPTMDPETRHLDR